MVLLLSFLIFFKLYAGESRVIVPETIIPEAKKPSANIPKTKTSKIRTGKEDISETKVLERNESEVNPLEPGSEVMEEESPVPKPKEMPPADEFRPNVEEPTKENLPREGHKGSQPDEF